MTTFCATGTPDPLVPSGPSSTPSSVPPGGYGVKALLGTKTVPSKSLSNKTSSGIKKFSPVASGSGSSITKEKIKKEKERVASIDKDKKKCVLRLISFTAYLTINRELKKKKRKRENDGSDIEEQPGAPAGN